MSIPFTHFRTAVVREVIEVRSLEGKGVEGDPMREVVWYLDPETGEQLAVRDDFANTVTLKPS